MWGAETKQTPPVEQSVCHCFGNWDIVCKLSLEKAVVSNKQTKQKAIDLISQCTDKESEAREMNLLKIIQLIRGQAGLRI